MIGPWLFRLTNIFGYVVEVVGYGQTAKEAKNDVIKTWPYPFEKIECVKFIWDQDDVWNTRDIEEIGII